MCSKAGKNVGAEIESLRSGKEGRIDGGGAQRESEDGATCAYSNNPGGTSPEGIRGFGERRAQVLRCLCPTSYRCACRLPAVMSMIRQSTIPMFAYVNAWIHRKMLYPSVIHDDRVMLLWYLKRIRIYARDEYHKCALFN